MDRILDRPFRSLMSFVLDESSFDGIVSDGTARFRPALAAVRHADAILAIRRSQNTVLWRAGVRHGQPKDRDWIANAVVSGVTDDARTVDDSMNHCAVIEPVFQSVGWGYGLGKERLFVYLEAAKVHVRCHVAPPLNLAGHFLPLARLSEWLTFSS
jgi:hypothetical protein